jgi:hypothetical protein
MSDVEIDLEGNKRWYNSNGLLHREDGPAIEYVNGTKFCYINDQNHREDGPAIEYENGNKEWYLNGKLHRIDGPAIELINGYKAWWVDDKLHRIDRPAVESGSGSKEWWVDGKLHRIDGPALEYNNGINGWIINGNEYNKEQFDEIVNFPDKEIPYISFRDSIYHVMFKDGVGIRLSHMLELYIDGRFIRWDWWLGDVILSFLRSSDYIEPLLDWIQENGNYFPDEFIEKLFFS